jgi:hypothetical protein
MRTLLLIACVTFALPWGARARASESEVRRDAGGQLRHRPGFNLTLQTLPFRTGPAIHPMFEPGSPRGSDASLRMDEMIQHAENTIIAGLEQAQHLGGKYRTWLWVTPVLGSMNGVTVRFDYR